MALAFVMRVYAQILALAAAFAALVGFGALATNSMRHLELKQQRALDADINWILAQRRKEIAKAQTPAPAQQPARASVAAAAPGRASEPGTNGAAPREENSVRGNENARRGEGRDAEEKDVEVRQAMAKARKNSKRAARYAGRRDSLLPRDFARLPLFTVETLLGFR